MQRLQGGSVRKCRPHKYCYSVQGTGSALRSAETASGHTAPPRPRRLRFTFTFGVSDGRASSPASPSFTSVNCYCVMRTFQGQNPENRNAHASKSWPSKRKFCKVPDSVPVHIIDDDDDDDSKDHAVEDTSKQIVCYNPEVTHEKQTDIDHRTSPRQSSKKTRHGYGTVLPSIGAYTVQCAYCHKWRIVPTKEKYEELRQSICEELFVCERAREWDRELSCDEPEDISQDGSRVWAIDRPSISQPPSGWDREVRIRGASSKFADVYYTSPSGKRLRSMVEIKRYLEENPDYAREGVSLSQFSFATPKPLQEDYIPKLTFGDAHEVPELPEIAQVDPLCLAAPPTRRALLSESSASAWGPAELPEMSGRVDLDQLQVSEPPVQPLKKPTMKQVTSRKCQRTPRAVSCSFEEQSGGHSNENEHDSILTGRCTGYWTREPSPTLRLPCLVLSEFPSRRRAPGHRGDRTYLAHLNPYIAWDH
ncbi:hypothetical protein U9M48_026327 [Paspalum notatum var. saurae]|uniref:Methyl-CpG-binding domain-containing protein 2 n=1 Tax=Paspalum notatum var. saurae TaxID=547442 RepID=A0AAQ3TX76_PASNO